MASSYSLDSVNANQHGSYQGRHLTVDFTQEKDISNNRSKISWTLKSTGGSSGRYTVGPTYVYINGEQVFYKKQISYSASSDTFPSSTGSVSGSIYVNHESNGKKSISVSLTTAVYYDGTGTTSGTWTLDDIPRASVIGSISNFNVESGCKVPITKYLSSFRDKLEIYVGSTLIKTIDNYTSNSQITFTDAEILKIYNATATNSKSATFTFKTTTYNGSSNIGTSSGSAVGTIQGLAYVNINGQMVRAVPWVKINNVWKRSIPKINNNGSWVMPR